MATIRQINVNGTLEDIDAVNVDGTEVDDITVDGTAVWKRVATGSCTNVLNTSASGTVTVPTTSTPDDWRWLVCVQSDMAGPPISADDAPVLNGTSMTTILSVANSYSSDGHRMGFWYAPIPSGSSQTVSGLSRNYGVHAFFVVHGIENFANNYTLSYSNSAVSTTRTITLSGVDTTVGAAAVGAAVTNFADSGGMDSVTNATLLTAGATSTCLDSAMSSGTLSYTWTAGGEVIVMAGMLGIEYDA